MRRITQSQPSSNEHAAEQELPLSALDAHPRLIGLYRYWDSKRGARSMPARSDLRPEEMAPFLGYVFLVDVEPAPRRFRFRLIGTEVATSYGLDLTGQYTDAVTPESYRVMIERHYAQAVEERRPLVHRMEFSEGMGKVHELIRLTLPLSDDGATVNMLLAASVFGPELRQFREKDRAARRSRRS
jgi:hypothetical protein